MLAILYLLISLLATTAGALTGMGGGVIIKPVLDALGHFDVESIGILSSVTVFSMSLVSIGRQLSAGSRISPTVALPLALGSVAGGLVGQKGLELILALSGSRSALVTMVQNILLCLLIAGVYLYMRNKARIPSLGKKSLGWAAGVGVLLGIISSFLGIGGGPINVALIIFIFSFDTKSAALCSLVTILFAQISKLLSVTFTTGFSPFDLSMLLPMVVGGVAGGLVGAALNRRFSQGAVERAFNGVQLVVMVLSLSNIIRSAMSL